MVWRIVAVLTGIVYIFLVGPNALSRLLSELHNWYAWSLNVLSPAPLGWKLEPRLFGAAKTAVSFYAALFDRLVWANFVRFEVSSFCIAFCVTWTLLQGSRIPLAACSVVLLLFCGGALAAALSFVATRVHRRMTQMLWTLGALFAGRMHSTLKHRTEPLLASLDTVVLALLLFTAVLLLYPVVMIHALLFAAIDFPRRMIMKLLF